MVSEKTGYPVEMLELEMGMDSDLGIDSIKRVEILSAIQERLPGSPIIGPEHLGSLHTLGEIARHLGAGAQTVTTAVSAPVTSADSITETLLAVVSEKTGYPVEMLELEMGMDSDLGIDSIKRVEILSAIQERLPGSPIIGPEHLGSLHTLGEIARHLGAGADFKAITTIPTPTTDSITETLLAVVSEKTGYPVEMLELEMGMDSDLGIDSIKRVEILSAIQERLPGSPVIGPEHLGSLHTLGEIARHLGAGAQTVTTTVSAPVTSADSITDTLLAVVSEKTGYPVEMLELEMGMDSGPGHRLHQTGRDPLGHPGAPARLTGHRPRTPRLPAHPGRDRPAPGRRGKFQTRPADSDITRSNCSGSTDRTQAGVASQQHQCDPSRCIHGDTPDRGQRHHLGHG